MLSVHCAGQGDAVAEPPAQFASVLRRLRTGAGLTQEELAEVAGLSSRAVSYLEGGVVAMPHKETVRLLADALHLDGLPRAEFEALARGRAALGGVTAAPRTLPRDIASFTGRRPELQELEDAAGGAAGSAGVPAIHAISGMAGIGKTAFVVHAAHRLAERFPGGQIFVPLHGHTPGHRPVSPADALASLLLVIGVPAAQIPAELEVRAGLWRDRLAGRQLLLILDDAADSEQVRPLLPGSGASLVLVTSRRRLTALEDARTISLETLPPEDAAGLLVRLAVRPGLSSADPAVSEIARLCGYLPLAIGMLARQLHHHPAWTVAGRAAELAAAVNRPELLVTENVSVAAAFDLSYADLAPGQQRLFRRLGLHPGADIDAYAAAALDGTSLSQAQRGLEALYDQHLLTEPTPGRYRMHDLIREHARALAGRLDLGDDREQAVARLLDYYQHAAARTDALLARQVRTAPARTAGTTSAPVPALATRKQALAWARAERASLLACLDHAIAAGQHARAIALTSGLAGLLRHDGPWAEAIVRHNTAVQLARHLSDRPAQADALTNRGDVQRLTGGYAAAARDLEEALDIHRELGDQRGQADALTFLGRMRQLAADYPAAARDLEEALDIYRNTGNRLGQANAVAYRGNVRLLTGDYPAAARDLEEALDVYREIGDRLSQADALTFLGRARLPTGDNPAAARELEEALDIYRDFGDRRGQANALTFLGRMRLATGDCPAAAGDLEEALDIYRDSGDRRGRANALLYLATVRRLTGDCPGAAGDLEEALGIYRDIGDRGGEVTALNEAGTLSRARDDLSRAGACHQQSLDLARQIGSAWDEAHALAGLGRCALADGRTAEAEAGLRQALAIFQRIGAAEAVGASAELDALRAC
jgi:tetratricopeptide (TPR) repeat protein/transcriptional regulator with XRE-family HTH domain